MCYFRILFAYTRTDMCLKFIACFHFAAILSFPLIQQSTVAAVQEKYMKDDEDIDYDD